MSLSVLRCQVFTFAEAFLLRFFGSTCYRTMRFLGFTKSMTIGEFNLGLQFDIWCMVLYDTCLDICELGIGLLSLGLLSSLVPLFLACLRARPGVSLPAREAHFKKMVVVGAELQ